MLAKIARVALLLAIAGSPSALLPVPAHAQGVQLVQAGPVRLGPFPGWDRANQVAAHLRSQGYDARVVTWSTFQSIYYVDVWR
jgi:hypothetical protein